MSDDNRTIWCGNLSEKVTEQLLYELFLQAAPLERVRIPVDKDGRQSNFAFVTVKHEISVDYTVKLLNGTTLYGRPLNLRARNTNRNQPSVEINHCVQIQPLLPAPQPLLNDCVRLEPLIRTTFNSNQRYADNYGRDDVRNDRRRDENRHSRSNSNNRKYNRRLRYY